VSGFAVVAEVFGFPRTAQRFFREVVLQTAGQDQRVLLRATAQYARLLRESFDARNMISAGDRWRHLVRECCASAANRRVGLAEACSLLRCDIPKFTRRRNARPVSWKIFFNTARYAAFLSSGLFHFLIGVNFLSLFWGQLLGLTVLRRSSTFNFSFPRIAWKRMSFEMASKRGSRESER